MERAKKMVLMPLETAERLTERKRGYTPDVPNNDAANRLDSEMQAILRLPGKSDREKWKLYRQVLQRYLFFAGGSRKPTEFDRATLRKEGSDIAVGNDADDGGDEEAAERLGVAGGRSPAIADIIVTLPQKYQRKAALLLDHLANTPDTVLSWDRQGEISVHGAPIRGTNIIDLINDVALERKNLQAVGRGVFANLLHEINTPKEYIGNPIFWKNNREATMPPMGVVARSPPGKGVDLAVLEEDEEAGEDEKDDNTISISSEEEEEKEVAGPSRKKARVASQTGGGHWWTLKLV